MKWSWQNIALVLLAVLAASLLGAQRAAAQACSFSMTDVSFGTVNLQSGGAVDTTATFSASCQGLALSTVRVCASFGAGTGGSASGGSPRYMLNGTQKLSYNLYSDPGRTTPFGGYTGVLSLLGGATLSVPLNASGRGTGSFSVYGRIAAGQSATPPGSYLSSFAGTQTTIYYQYVSILTCAAILNGSPSQAPFTVTATVPTMCTVSATNMDFGSVATLAGALTATGSITANCTITTPYEIGLDGGLSAATDPTQRKMALSGNSIIYGLYRNTQHTLPWGNVSGSTTVTGTGTGAAQSITVYGAVPAQATPRPGLYSDTVVVTLTY